MPHLLRLVERGVFSGANVTQYELITIAFSALNLVVLVVGLGVAVRQAVLARQSVERVAETTRAEHDWNRRSAAQQAISNYNFSLILSALQRELNYLNRNEAISLTEIEEAFSRDAELQTELFKLLNFYEAIARGIHQGIYDEDVIKASRRTAILKAHRAFADYIDHRRHTARSPRAWCEFTSLANRWASEANETVQRGPTA